MTRKSATPSLGCLLNDRVAPGITYECRDATDPSALATGLYARYEMDQPAPTRTTRPATPIGVRGGPNGAQFEP